MKNISIFVALDVHKESIDIAQVEDNRNSAVRYYGMTEKRKSSSEVGARSIKPESANLFWIDCALSETVAILPSTLTTGG